jgi:flagella basal body P-ring formation protein FlgA
MWMPLLLMLQSGCVAVPGDRIRAGDLAPAVAAFSILDPQTFIGYAPLPGLERWLTSSDVRRALGAGAAVPELPASVCVVRAASSIDGDEIRNAMRAALPEDAELDLLDWTAAAVPAGRPEFLVTGLRRTPEPERYVWRGRWMPERGGRSIPVGDRVRIRLRRSVVVAARAIESGAVLSPEDLTVEQRNVPLPPGPAQPEPRTLAGYRTRRPLAAGQPVELAQLIPPPAARAGQTVTLICESGTARIAVEAEALTAGRLGDVILVKSPLNGKRLRARLEGPGRAVAERSSP